MNITLFGYLVSKYGLSAHRSNELCKELGFLPTTPFGQLSSENVSVVKLYSDVFISERSTMNREIHQKVKIGTIQGIRMRLGRPVRGQRTHTNGNTASKLNKGRVNVALNN